jgi:hypothetical protein
VQRTTSVAAASVDNVSLFCMMSHPLMVMRNMIVGHFSDSSCLYFLAGSRPGDIRSRGGMLIYCRQTGAQSQPKAGIHRVAAEGRWGGLVSRAGKI